MYYSTSRMGYRLYMGTAGVPRYVWVDAGCQTYSCRLADITMKPAARQHFSHITKSATRSEKRLVIVGRRFPYLFTGTYTILGIRFYNN